MIASTAPGLTLIDLERALHRVEPAALLVPPRILRRVIKSDRQLTGPGLQVPHRKSYFLDRAALLRIADGDELGLAPDRELPEHVLLFPLPDAGQLKTRPRAETLLAYWRLLFHAGVHRVIARRRAAGMLDDATVRARVAQLGSTAFDEVRAVLRQENFLLSPGDAAAVYEEFAAVYLELRAFERDRLPSYFPACTDLDHVDRVLAADVDADAILAATRPEGAPDPVIVAPSDSEIEPPEPAELDAAPAAVAESDQALLVRADRAAARGNRVRAAILRQRAIRAAPRRRQRGIRIAASGEIEQLLTRLRQALDFPETDAPTWRAPLLALLEPASRGIWPAEARFLYDLQAVCIDRERAIYAVDLVEWAVSWGRRPIKRPLPNQPLILTVKHLRQALHRLAAVRIAEPLRLQLVHRMIDALHRSEQALRARFHPLIQDALDRVGLKAENYAERMSRDKLIEELLDRVVERRFLSMSDLRDAIARNQLKLPDLDGPVEFLRGDKLIRANREFATALDGVYRRGEVYLRWLQRFSALAFGTAPGRFLTRYLALPFGGAYLGLEALHHILELFQKHPGPQNRIATTVGLLAAPTQGPLLAASALVAHHHVVKLVNPYSVVALGCFLLAVLHVDRFRQGLSAVLSRAWHGVRTVVFEWPAAFFDLPVVRRFLASRAYLLCYQFILKPFVWAAPVALTCHLLGLGLGGTLATAIGVFLIATVLNNSRLGRDLEETSTDAALRSWRLLRRDLIPGLYRLVMAFFKRCLEDVERLLYAVDELLRFRAGDNPFALVWKPALGLIWFCITYLIRLIINVFVEPTFNPIKHFPVVTVTAKLLVPVIRPLTLLIMVPLVPVVGRPLALALAGVAIFLLPGLAGFLVWELKENWRLYRSNRPATLQPVVVGTHGETIGRFLRPGFHSGTLPKLYARLRRAHGTAAHRQYEALHHVRDQLCHFVERDLLAILAFSRRWAMAAPRSGDIHLATNRIRFELHCPALGDAGMALDFAEHAGFLVAGIAPARAGRPSWLAHLEPAQTAAFADALAGFYKIAGVELVRQQIDAVLSMPYDLTDAGLVIWPGPELPSGAIVDLHTPALAARPLAGTQPPSLPSLTREKLLFTAEPVTWSAWVAAWELDQAGKSIGAPLLRDVLPMEPPGLPGAGDAAPGKPGG